MAEKRKAPDAPDAAHKRKAPTIDLTATEVTPPPAADVTCSTAVVAMASAVGAREEDVTDGVTECQAARLELGLRPPRGARGEAGRGVGEQRLGGAGREDLVGVRLPVGGDVQVAAGLQPQRERVHEIGPKQAPLVMAFFRPRVGEVDVHAAERRRRDHVGDDLDRVVAHHAHVAKTAGVEQASGGTAYVHPCDLTDLEQVDALVAKVLDQHDHVDVLVNNAGMSIRRKVRHSVDRFHDFERPMQLNYFAAVRLTMGLLPTMVERESGQVVNISSWAALLRPARFSGYAASKAALEAWSDSVQGEVLGDGVVFTNVRMPLVRTPMIAPTKLYRRVPALTVDQAAQVVTEAVVTRSRRVTPLAAAMVSWAESVSPGLGDLIRKNAV